MRILYQPTERDALICIIVPAGMVSIKNIGTTDQGPDLENMNLERYIEQLIADLRAAYKPEGISVYPEFEDNPEPVTTMFQLTGIDPNVFPPVKDLSESQLQRLYCLIKCLADRTEAFVAPHGAKA